MNAIIITGATGGIGYECALQLAKTAIKEQLVIACRSLPAGKQILEKLKTATDHENIICLTLDLESLQSVKAFVQAFAATGNKVSALVNNAGLQNVGETKFTKDSFEKTFVVNHLAPLYLTLLLLPYCTPDARITFTSSGTHDPRQKTGMPAPDFTSVELLAHPKTGTEKVLKQGQTRYTTSKLCNIMTVYQLQSRLAGTGIHVNAFDPGLVPGTGLAKSYPPVLKFISDYVFKILIPFMKNVNTAKNSGKRLANLAFGADFKNASGKYFEGEKEIRSSEESYNPEKQKTLWQGSLALLPELPAETMALIR